MPRQAKKYFANTIKSLKPSDKEYTLSVGNGLQLRIYPSGKKTWLSSYTSPIDKKRKRISLGNYPTLPLSEAEQKQREFKQLVKDGLDPKMHSEKLKREIIRSVEKTFKVKADEYFALKRKILKDSTIRKWESALLNDVYPIIGNIPVDQLTFKDGEQIRDRIIKRGSFDIARKVCNYLEQIASFCNLNPNPFSNLTKNVPWPIGEHYRSIHPSRLPELFSAIQLVNIDVQTRLLLEFQILTLARSLQTVQIEWQHINFEKAMWVAPPETTKGKKGTERQHRVPLSSQAIRILNVLHSMNGQHRWVFPSKINKNKHMNSETVNKAIQKTKLGKELVAHGLRSIGTVALKEIGEYEHNLVESALSHVAGDKTVQAYTRTDFYERRISMMEWWGKYVMQAKQSAQI